MSLVCSEFDDLMKKDTVATAKALLGMELYLRGKFLGTIVETEAYLGSEDSASHSANGRRSSYNEAMYLSAGHWHVYQMYGNDMLNFVTRSEGVAEAILIRALEVAGEEIPANGPGKLTKFSGITKALDGKALSDDGLQLKKGAKPQKIFTRARVGITSKDQWLEKELCFYVAHNRHVSKISKKDLLPDKETWLEENE